MPLDKNYIPSLPFSDYKWRWASVTCTEGLNDPVIYLGILKQLLRCRGKKYNSPEFTEALSILQKDISPIGLKVRIGDRTGERNIMRNSQQYWKALGLIPSSRTREIELTPLGVRVAEREISQTDFAAVTVLTLTLPNRRIEKEEIIKQWDSAGLKIHPLTLILRCLVKLYEEYGQNEAYLTGEELLRIIIPLSGSPEVKTGDYANFLKWFRNNELTDIELWPEPNNIRGNDKRMACEFLIFLMYYGYLHREKVNSKYEARYFLNLDIINEIKQLILLEGCTELSIDHPIINPDISDIAGTLEGERIRAKTNRPRQTAFRQKLLNTDNPRCVITNVSYTGVLEAAHIKPYAYSGSDDISNGILLRSDIHTLFDSGDLRINPKGEVYLTERVKFSYGEATIRDLIKIPEYVDLKNIEWRWEYYHSY